MKIFCVQMNMLFEKPDYNFSLAEKLITEASENGADVIVLPEMWNTGFFPKNNLSILCDNNGERVKSEIGFLAEKYNVNIVAGSIANIKDSDIYNTSYVFDRNGICIKEYDKVHLFSPMGEDKYFEKGCHFCKFNIDGINCGVIICYDLRFPEITRTLAVNGIDVLFVVSQWPKERIEHYITLAKARAIENQIFVVCCNSCGEAERTIFGGNSCIIDPLGKIIAQAGETEQILNADIDLSVLENIRNTINIYNDRRTDLY